MRAATLTLLFFVAFGYAAKAQKFSLLPQVGFENSKTNISYNDQPSFSPLGVKFSPQASLRLNYASKLGHGFFFGLASSQSSVSYSFANPETGMSSYVATAGDMQLRLEGGYQFNSKKIALGKSKQATTKTSSKPSTSSSSRHGCCKRYSCSSSRSSESKKAKEPSTGKTGGSWVRIQPSVGMGYIPFAPSSIESEMQNGQTMHEYTAGNWNTAVLAGTSFEFGKNSARLFTVSVNYFKGLGNLGTETVTAQSGGKTVTANLKSSVSGWNMRIGIPFTLGGTKKTTKKPQATKSGCGQYRTSSYRCGYH